MSPREKHLALLSALCLVLVSFTFYYIPIFLYATLFFAVCCIVVSYYRNGEPFPARRWLGLSALARLRRWLSNRRWSGVPVAARRGARSGRNKADVRHSSTEHFGDFRIPEAGIYRREALSSESFLFSPRDFLMGSYISKPESPTAQHVTSRAGRNPRELLREKLSRPNHAVYTPNRRLSFSGEPMGSLSRLSITPQRHYPLQQAGPSSMGVLPPVKWDAFRKKNVLSPRNSQSAMSPVTVKIARPDHHSIPSFEHVSCAGLPRAPADPCSRESVLKVLKESRKREPEDQEASFTAEQRSKRRRNDSGGSSHSAFGSLLPNGTPSQLVPKPGTLKRGLLSLAEESIMKRSRTSSVSSASGTQRGTQSGTPGSRRNPINSSYSSSKGLGQWKKRSAPSSTLSSPGSSRPQTPEGIAKRPREDDGQSPSSASSVRSDHTAAEKAPAASKLTPVPKIPVTTATDSTGSGGKRKRKIQLVSSHRDDHISLPPPPEIGYVITVKDLDEEKKAAISKIQKVLETPAPEPEKSISAPISVTSSAPAFTTSAATLSSLLSTPLSLASSPAIPVINLDPTPNPTSTPTPVSTAPTQAPNPLLEMLKKSTTPASFTTTSEAAAATTTVSATTTPAQPSILGNLKLPTTLNSSQPQPSAFTQVLGQVTKATSSTASPLTITGSGGLFGIGIGMGPISSPSSSAVSNTVTANATATSSLGSVNTTTPNPNPLLASGFKPIFSVTTTTSPAVSMTSPESKPPMPQCFTPIFGQPASLANTTTASNHANLAAASSTFSTTAANTTPSMSMFGGLTGSSTATVATSGFPGLTTDSMATQQQQQPTAVKSLFGFGIAPSSATTSTISTLASTLAQPLANAGSTFQFGAPATMTTAAVAPATTVPTATTTSGSGAFGGFGATQPDQKVFSFGQGAPIQSNNTTAQPSNTFGGFGMATTAPSSMTTTAANTQSTFSFGKSSFQSQPTTLATGQPPSFSSTQSAAPNTQATKPFSFGTSIGVASSSTPTPASNLNLNPTANQPSFAFGSGTAAITTATTFGTPSQPTGFGAGSTGGFAFGGVGASNTAAATTAANSINPLANSNNPLAAAPSFGAVTQQTQSALPQSSNAFSFGGSVATTNQQVPVNPLATTTQSGFNFGGAGMPPCPQFGTPVASNPNTQMGFNFGAAADKPAFGTSTPAFGQSSAAAGPIPFGSPATPVPGFNQSFGSPATPSFSIGAGSKPSGARQRLQARRQHNRKK